MEGDVVGVLDSDNSQLDDKPLQEHVAFANYSDKVRNKMDFKQGKVSRQAADSGGGTKGIDVGEGVCAESLSSCVRKL